MQKAYQRRTLLLLAFAALDPTAAHAADTLWDVLVRAPVEPVTPTAAVAATPRSSRRTLGPVPGFTLPAVSNGSDNGSPFASRRPKRSGIFGSVGEWFGRMQSATGTKIKFSGESTFSLRSDSVSGNTGSFRDSLFMGQGNNGFYNNTRMEVDATFFKHFTYKTSINNNPFYSQNDPNNNRVKLDYNTKKVRFEWGDLNAGFTGNSLIDFNRFLNGMQLTNEWSRQFRTQLLYSTTKAETRTITVPGNGSTGPYYVFAGLIVDGSARVRVNERDMNLGTDYTLDTYTGELRFLRGNVVLPTDTIAVTFETVGYNQSRGNIYGVRAEYMPTSGTKFGLTNVMQTSQGSTGITTRTQNFYGYNTPAAAYVLDAPIDLTKPFNVTVGGRPLIRNVDYVVDANLTNQIRIAQAVPPNIIVQVVYVPLNLSPVPGNRSVLGLDGQVSLGKLGRLTTEMALSGLALQGSNFGGSAWRVNAELNPLRNLRTSFTLRDISPTFSSIQSPGFNRNEKAAELFVDYSPTNRLRFTGTLQKALRPSFQSSSGQYNVTSAGNDTYDQYGLNASYNFSRTGSLTFSRTKLGTRFIQGGQSENANDSLTLAYGLGTLNFDFSLSRIQSGTETRTTLTSQTPTLFGVSSNTFSKRFNVNWNATKWLSLNTSLSDNDIRTNSQNTLTTANARDFTSGLQFSLIRNLRLNFNYQLSDTGNFSSQSTNTGATGSTTTTGGSSSSGSGLQTRSLLEILRSRQVTAGGSNPTTLNNSNYGSYYGGGNNYNLGGYGNYSGAFGTNLTTGYGDSSFGGRRASTNLGIEYAPRSNMRFNLSFNRDNSLGDYQYNRNSNGTTFLFRWDATKRMSLDFNYIIQRSTFTGGLGGANNTIMDIGFSGNPFGGKLNLALNWRTMKNISSITFSNLTGSGNNAPTDTSQALTSISARVDFPIARRYSLFTEFNQSTVNGYQGNTNGDMRFGVDYMLTDIIKLSLGWQTNFVQNRDPQLAEYNYHASSLLAELGFRF